VKTLGYFGGQLGVALHADIQIIQGILFVRQVHRRYRRHLSRWWPPRKRWSGARAARACTTRRGRTGLSDGAQCGESVAEDPRSPRGSEDHRRQRLLKQESDQITRADRLKLDYLAEEVEAMQASALKNRDLAVAGMRLLIRGQAEEALDVAQEPLPAPPPQPVLEQVTARALDQRPEIRAAEEAVKGRQALVDLETARFYPDLAIVGGASYTEQTNASNPVSPFVYNPYTTPRLPGAGHARTWEIPQKMARKRQAEADLAEALSLRRGAELLVRLEVQQALAILPRRGSRWIATPGKRRSESSSPRRRAWPSIRASARRANCSRTRCSMRAPTPSRLGALFDAHIAWAALEKARAAPYNNVGDMIAAAGASCPHSPVRTQKGGHHDSSQSCLLPFRRGFRLRCRANGAGACPLRT